MDSLTQIVLGAAVGEALLGKRLDNRAVLWGAIAGTIPDLDVIPGFFMSQLEGLGFHRGPSHSIVFSLLAPIPAAWLTQRFYNHQLHNTSVLKWWNVLLITIVFFLPLLLFWQVENIKPMHYLTLLLPVLGVLIFRRLHNRYIKSEQIVETVSFKEWYLLFALGFLTHILLDCFTTYGTQIYLPFSSERVAWNTISVVDPLYTLPFLFCLIVAMRHPAAAGKRRVWNTLGLILSSIYLLFTVVNKVSVDQAFSTSLKESNIEISRFHSTPTMFNNALWYGIGEAENGFYYAYYSIFDDSYRAIRWQYVERGLDAGVASEDIPPAQTLNWFSDGFYQFRLNEENKIIWKDLRFGNMDFMQKDAGREFVFYFEIFQTADNLWEIMQRRPEVQNPSRIWKDLITRIKGLENK